MKYVNLILAVTALGVSTIAAANTGTITINGKIFNETCILSGGSNATGTTDVTVTLDTIPSSSFTSTVRLAGKKDFDLSLTKTDGTACYTTTLGSSLAPVVTLSTTSPAAYQSNGIDLNNQATIKSTTNPVYVQILARTSSGDTTGAVVNYSNTATQAKATYDSTANKFYYAAQYSAGAGAIIPEAQNVNAVVTYTITYP
jgi:major type 1 subunit fimbrin (pilin)